LAGAAISGFEIASSASPPRKDKTKGVLLGALNFELSKDTRPFNVTQYNYYGYDKLI